MDSPDDSSKSGADVRATETVDVSVLTSEERLAMIKEHLRSAIDEIGVAMRENNLFDIAEAASVANISIGKALYNCDAQGGMREFSDEENRFIRRLKNRDPDQIGKLVSTTVYLLTALKAREEPVLSQVGWDADSIESHLDRSMTQKLFLSQFIACLDEIIQEPTVDSMIKTHTLVSAYLRLGSDYLSDEQKDCVNYCMDFENFMAEYFVVLVEGSEKIDISELESINNRSKSKLEDIHLNQDNVN